MILVTGAGGTVGSELVKQLKSAGATFRAAFHSESKAEAARKEGLDAVVIDYERPETLRDALRGVDKLFLLSGGAPNQTEREIQAVNTAKAAGVKHLVKLSVLGAAEQKFSFAKIHHAVEKAIESSGLSWTFLRPNGFMQNMVNYNGASIKGQRAFYGNTGDAKISHVDVRDIAAVATKVLTTPGHEGKSYDLTGPEALSYGQVAEKLTRAAGKPVNYVNLSDADLRKGAVDSGIPEAYADALLDLNAAYKRGDGSRVSGDVKRIIGRDPINFDQYAKDNAAAFH